jgi:hypothetical protein
MGIFTTNPLKLKYTTLSSLTVMHENTSANKSHKEHVVGVAEDKNMRNGSEHSLYATTTKDTVEEDEKGNYKRTFERTRYPVQAGRRSRSKSQIGRRD